MPFPHRDNEKSEEEQHMSCNTNAPYLHVVYASHLPAYLYPLFPLLTSRVFPFREMYPVVRRAVRHPSSISDKIPVMLLYIN